MIREEYVSFETAKFLKEKGFDWECIGYYVDDEPDDVKYSLCGETNSIWESRCCSAPTHQMAMKWLREMHNIVIVIDVCRETGQEGFYCWQLENNRTGDWIDNIVGECLTYEQACEAAIKYCLEYLI